MSSWPKAWSWEVHPTKSQHDPKCDQMSTWPKAWTWQVHLTKGQPDPKLPKCQPDQSLILTSGGYVNLTKGQPDPKCDQMSTWPKAWWWAYVWPKVSLTWKIWQKCQPDLKPHLFWVLLTKCKKDIWKFEHTLQFRSCFTEVFSMKPKVCIYVCMCVCVKIECSRQRMIEKVFQIQEIFDSLIKRIPVIEVSWKSVIIEPRYSTKHAVLKLA